MADFLANNRHLPASRREEMEKNTGVKDLERGLLQSQQLRRWAQPSKTIFDVLHCFYSNGIVSLEIKLCTDRLASSGCSRQNISDWFLDLGLEKYHDSGSKLDVRCLTRSFFGDVWKADGSTQLSFMPLWHYFAIVYRGQAAEACADELRCLQLLGCRTSLLEMLRWTKQEDLLPQLNEQQCLHHNCFCRVYGRERARPKHHYSLKQGGWPCSASSDFSKQVKFFMPLVVP